MFSESTLNMLPTPALGSLSNGLTAKAMDKASEVSAEKARAEKQEGYTEVDSTWGGRTVSVLKNTLSTVQSHMGVIKAAMAAYGMAKTLLDGDEEAFDPDTLPPGTTGSQAEVDTMGAELSQVTSQGAADSAMTTTMGLQMTQTRMAITAAEGELNNILEDIGQVNDVISKRATGELPNPSINVDKVGAALQNSIGSLSAMGFTTEQMALLEVELQRSLDVNMDDYERYVENNIVIPYVENRAALDLIRAQLLGTSDITEVTPIFDTVFGPPVSTSGKFILSEDGIYYDSRNGTIPYITAEKIDSRSWELRYASNRGGKGELYGDEQNARFADTIMSYEYKNESGSVKDFYKYDDILQNLKNDRNLQIQDVSGKISDLVNLHGYASDDAVIVNYEDSYAAIGFAYESKIKKRKKQLQIAALFGPYGVTLETNAQGEGLFYTAIDKQNASVEPGDGCGSDTKVQRLKYKPNDDWFEVEAGTPIPESERQYIPRIPINDFTYLKEIGLVPELDSQASQMLHSSDLDDTTAPIPPIFLTQGAGQGIQAIPERAIAPEGLTDWINTSGDTSYSSYSSLSGTVPYLRTLESDITTDNLVVCYNFLEPDATVPPSSTVFGVRNYTDDGYPLNAKLVAKSASSVFVSGVSIPYLKGNLFDIQGKYGIRYAHLSNNVGSYVRLPNNFRDNKVYRGSQPLDNLMYNSRGWSFDFWAYTPDLSSGLTTSHRYKLVAANENCGEPVTDNITSTRITTASMESLIRMNRDARTKGLIIGWRDPGNPGTTPSGLQFGVWPTVAQNDDIWGKSVCIGETVSGDGGSAACRVELGFKVLAGVSSLSGYTIGSASGAFTHYNICCDHKNDAISLYVNGQFLASSLVSTSFDVTPGTSLNIPSRISEGAYQDQDGRFGEQLYTGDLSDKPPIFTPWILGGGFTDGVGHEVPPLFSSTLPGFLGTNTNSSYYRVAVDGGGGPFGQHSVAAYNQPGLGGYTPTGSNYQLARSGLDGHLGSFKMYSKPLSTIEIEKNYNAQRPFFTGIKLPFRLI